MGNAAELGYEVTVVKDATPSYTDDHMRRPRSQHTEPRERDCRDE